MQKNISIDCQKYFNGWVYMSTVTEGRLATRFEDCVNCDDREVAACD